MNGLKIFCAGIFLVSACFGCIHMPEKQLISDYRFFSPPETASQKASPPLNAQTSEASSPSDTTDPAMDDDINTCALSDALQADEGMEDETGKSVQEILDEALDFCQASQDFWQKGELENAIESLDHAYSLILGVDTGDDPKLIQQKDDLRFTISKRTLEIYASRNIVVNGNHNAIPIDINRHVQSEIDLFTKGREKFFFIESYKRSGKYRAYIVAELKKAGLPTELSWLPLIESGFKAKALSKARALGLWQFIPSTGYKFGLKRNTYIDERLDYKKATAAAIDYLKELHKIFGDWTTVLAAYNCGEGRVLRIIRDQNVNYLDDFWDLYQRLPLETARYVPRFLATLHIVKNKEKYGLNDIQPAAPLQCAEVEINRQVHLKDLAKAIDASYEELKELNPELRHGVLPNQTYAVRVPEGKQDALLAAIEKLPTSSPLRDMYAYYRIRKGDTLSRISKRFGVSVSSISRANNIRRQNCISIGKVLKIPQRAGAPAITYAKSTRTSSSRSSATVSHTVKRGDSLWILAKHYGTTTGRIQSLNHLRSTRLHIGQKLQIPTSSPQAGTKYKTYRVKNGDSPFKIAKMYDMPLERFLRINNLLPRNKIFPGQKLYVE